MYPLHENYRDLIKDFTSKLKEFDGLEVATGCTSTVLVGEYARVMECLTEMLSWSHGRHGRGVFVTKILPGYDPN